MKYLHPTAMPDRFRWVCEPHCKDCHGNGCDAKLVTVLNDLIAEQNHQKDEQDRVAAVQRRLS